MRAKKKLHNLYSDQSLYPSMCCFGILERCAHGYRRARATIVEKDLLAEDSAEMQSKREQEAEERRKQSHDMVAESIRRELAESMSLASISHLNTVDIAYYRGEGA